MTQLDPTIAPVRKPLSHSIAEWTLAIAAVAGLFLFIGWKSTGSFIKTTGDRVMDETISAPAENIFACTFDLSGKSTLNLDLHVTNEVPVNVTLKRLDKPQDITTIPAVIEIGKKIADCAPGKYELDIQAASTNHPLDPSTVKVQLYARAAE